MVVYTPYLHTSSFPFLQNILLLSAFIFDPNYYIKTVGNTIRFFAATLPVSILFSDCKKDAAPSNNTIQQGNTTIEINAIYTGTPGGSSRFLQVRYNNVINAPINVAVTFYLKNGQQKNIPVAIAAGYKNLVFYYQ